MKELLSEPHQVTAYNRGGPSRASQDFQCLSAAPIVSEAVDPQRPRHRLRQQLAHAFYLLYIYKTIERSLRLRAFGQLVEFTCKKPGPHTP